MASDQPPSPDAGGSDDEPAQIVVDDPEDFAKTRQLRTIFDARDDYIDARREANRDHEDGELTFPQKNRRIFRHLQDLAMTMEPLLRSQDEGREIWNDRTYGVDRQMVAESDLPSFREAYQALQEVVNDSTLPTGDIDNLLERYKQRKENQTISFGNNIQLDEIKRQIRQRATDWGWETEGLSSLGESTPTLTYPVEHGRKGFATTAPPQEVSDKAFRDLQDFIRTTGLGVKFDEEQQTKIDDDLLKEVDQWRQQNT